MEKEQDGELGARQSWATGFLPQHHPTSPLSPTPLICSLSTSMAGIFLVAREQTMAARAALAVHTFVPDSMAWQWRHVCWLSRQAAWHGIPPATYLTSLLSIYLSSLLSSHLSFLLCMYNMPFFCICYIFLCLPVSTWHDKRGNRKRGGMHFFEKKRKAACNFTHTAHCLCCLPACASPSPPHHHTTIHDI